MQARNISFSGQNKDETGVTLKNFIRIKIAS